MLPDDVDQAISVLAEQGITSPSLGISAARAADAADIARSTIYRHWPSVDQLNDDLAWYIVTRTSGWHQRLIDTPPSVELAAAITAAVAGDEATDDEWGVQVRAAVTAWNPHTRAPAAIAAWELAALDRLERWIRANVREHGRVWIDDAAAPQCALTCSLLVEGAFLVGAYGQVASRLRMPTRTGEQLGAAIAQLVHALTAPAAASRGGGSRTGPGDPPGPAAPEDDLEAPRRAEVPDPTLPPTAEAILERIVGAFVAQHFDSSTLVAPGRMVDAARLARRLDVSERALYDRWPSTSGFNAAVAERIVVQLRARLDQQFDQAMTAVLTQDPDELTELLHDELDDAVRAGSAAAGRSIFVTAVALVDPTVRSVTGPFIETWRTSVRTGYLAWLSLTHATVRPPLTPLWYGDLHMMAVAGAWRMACTHPQLLRRTTVVAGRTAPLLAAAIHTLSLATSRPIA